MKMVETVVVRMLGEGEVCVWGGGLKSCWLMSSMHRCVMCRLVGTVS